MADPFDVAAFCSGYQRRIESTKLCTRPDLILEHGRLDAELRDVASSDPDRAKELAQAVTDLEAKIAEAQQEFRFQGLADLPWADLLKVHAPTKEQLADNDSLGYNPDTFPAAVIAASSLEPALSPEAVALLRETVPPSDFEKLWQAALTANREVVDAPKSELATVVLRTSGASSTTAAPGVSPAGSSSASNARPSPSTTTTRTAA